MKKEYNVAFIGGGNMAGAIIDAMLSSAIVPSWTITVSDPSEHKRNMFKQKGINVVASNPELCSKDIIFLAVKPQIMDDILSEIRPHLNCKCIVT